MNDRMFAARYLVAFVFVGAAAIYAQSGGATYSATATVKTAGAANLTAPIKIVVTRTMPRDEAEALTKAFAAGGMPALRKALNGVAPTGSVQLGSAKEIATRLTLERPTDQGSLLTIVTDQPIWLIGAGAPAAKEKAGYDLGVVDLVLDAQGAGTGMISPAAKVSVKQGVFVVEDYAGEMITLTGVRRAR